MDMNQLFYHHQMAVMTIDRARREGTPLANFDLPDHYARRIDDYRARRGMAAYFVAPPARARKLPRR